jgi:hypothetical protein
MSGRNFRPCSPFYRDEDQTLTLSLLRNDRGVRRGERSGSAYAGHATRPDRTARACALHELRADAADAASRRRYAGRYDHRLGDKLARSDGVLCPPAGVDPEIRAPTPETGNTPVIPPPGSPGGDPTVRPK